MKQFIIFLAVTMPSLSFAQLKVDSIGKVTMGSVTSNCRLTVNNKYEPEGAASFQSMNRGMDVKLNNTSNDSTYSKVGMYVDTKNYTKTLNFGVLSLAKSECATSKACAGLFGVGNGRTGYSFGAIGCKNNGTGFGAGVFGSATLSYNNYVDGNYAGYFKGDVKVTGVINGTLVSSSDSRLKENLHDIGEEGDAVLNKLDLLTPVSYNYINAEAVAKNASRQAGTESQDSLELLLMEGEMLGEEKPNQVLLKKHYGLLAQELQQVYPDLVYENDNGYLSINYTELIPILLQSIKELKAQVDELRSPSSMNAKAMAMETSEATGMGAVIADVAGMDQNVPNPFSGKTDIAIYLPETVQTAMLYIYDLSGKQVEQHVIEGRGNTIMTIHADRMDAGMYIYSLIADGKVVATKRMIVMK